jgi:hypothetical protein
MIERAMPPPREGASSVEEALRRFLWKLPGHVSFVVDFEPHGRRHLAEDEQAAGVTREPVQSAGSAGTAGTAGSAGSADALQPRLDCFSQMLEAGADQLAVASAAYREQCRQAAVQARALDAFAVHRPAAVLDRPDEGVGSAAAASRAARPQALTAVSEWAVDEVMVALGLSSLAAAKPLEQSITVVEQLPATLTALEAGTISWSHAVMLADVLSPLRDPGTRAEVEAGLLQRAAGRTVPQLRAAARRAVLRADATAAARRLAAAIRDRSVRVFPGEDGMASLAATLPTPVALACRKALEVYAEECATPGDERNKDQWMVDCLADLLLRPGSNGESQVRIDLMVVASVDTLTGGEELGEVDGQPVPAVVVREQAHPLGLLPRPQAPRPRTVQPVADALPAGAARRRGRRRGGRRRCGRQGSRHPRTRRAGSRRGSRGAPGRAPRDPHDRGYFARPPAGDRGGRGDLRPTARPHRCHRDPP